MSLNLITVSISFQFLPGGMSIVILITNDFLEIYYYQIVHREMNVFRYWWFFFLFNLQIRCGLLGSLI